VLKLRFDCRDGRLQEGDQILAIDGQLLDANISHKQAIHILQQAKGLVEIVVARGQTQSQANSDHQRSASTVSADMVRSSMVTISVYVGIELSSLEVILLLQVLRPYSIAYAYVSLSSYSAK